MKLNVDVRDFSEAEPEPEEQPSLGIRILRNLRDLLLVVVVAVVLSSLLRIFIFQVYLIPSGSMENTLLVNDRIIASKVTGFDRGDVVVFADSAHWMSEVPSESGPFRRGLEFIGVIPSSDSQYLVKRVIGLPGDRVIANGGDGRISVNGVELEEDYLYSKNGNMVDPSQLKFDVVVPEGRLFVMGDHRDRSGDSRLHLCDVSASGEPQGMAAFVPIDDVVGPAVLIVAPLSRFQRLTTPDVFASVPDPTGNPPAEPVVTVNGSACR